jgi:superfamily II DNA or RNA helicase
MFGEHTQEERRKAIVQLEIGEIDAIIGSKILDVGVDVPSIDLVILAGGGKAEVELRQRIGRGLRAKKVGGNVCFVADFTDDWNKHTYSHAFTRRQIVESIDGFKQGVLKAGEDFDFNLRLQAA